MRNYFFLLAALCITLSVLTQIAPPGLTKKGGASWFAVGVKQQLKKKGSSVSSYIGLGRVGITNRNNPFQNHSIFVANISYKKSFKSVIFISPYFSYRHQKIYIESFYNEKQEFRLGLEIGKLWKLNRLELKSSFKQEVRKFYDASFRNWEESIHLRSRLKLSGNYQLTKSKQHHLSSYVELLFSLKKHIHPNIYWEKIKYSDTRLSFFYSYSIPKPNMIFSLGYMIDLIGWKNVSTGNYISLDLVWKNPFHKN